jgi:aspartyl-tRNA(Asn)/glutamyl-tRNA(Gln) amidotransferase subunit A
LRIAFSPTLGYAKVQGEVANLVAAAAKVFEDLGANVEEVAAPFPDPSEIFRAHFFAGIAHSTRGLQEAQLAKLDRDLAKLLGAAKRVTLSDYMTAIDARAALGRATRALHERYDLLLTPTLAVLPFAAGRLAPEGYDNDWINWTPFTYPFNLTGQPAATVPCGFAGSDRPVGLQIVAGMHHDALVLRAAQAYQGARPAHNRHPDI